MFQVIKYTDYSVREWGESSPRFILYYTRSATAVLGGNVSVSQVVFAALSPWALGQTVNRTRNFVLAGKAPPELVKSPLLLFHATLSARLQAFSWEKAGETDSRLGDTLCGRAARSSQQPTPRVYRRAEKPWCQQMSPTSTKRPHKKTLPSKCLTCTMKISYDEKLGARFNFA